MKLLLNPQYFYRYSLKLALTFGVLAILLFCYGLVTGLFIAPVDYQQKEAMRIMYIHVPTAILSLSVYTIIGCMSFVYLIWKVKLADVIAQVSAPFGAVVTALALITGSIWGKPMWGTWWVWDARLTSELILLFLYFGYMGLRSAITDQRVAASMCAILALVGLIDIPIIHFSVNWWNTLHQGASLTRLAKPSIDAAMLYPLLSVLAATYFLYFAIICLQGRAEVLWRERKTKWVRDLIEEDMLNAKPNY